MPSIQGRRRVCKTPARGFEYLRRHKRITPKVTRGKKEFSEKESKYDGWQQLKLSNTVSRQNKDEGSKLKSFKYPAE